ncbi:hypothetical protein, partial [Pseudomonas sp. 008]|uniref:hypothetical protein n=1 Tax=Pseudomonas sp. 008 TaxID=2803906 RepID=UPI001952314D
LAGDGIAAVIQTHRGVPIASKPAPTKVAQNAPVARPGRFCRRRLTCKRDACAVDQVQFPAIFRRAMPAAFLSVDP